MTIFTKRTKDVYKSFLNLGDNNDGLTSTLVTVKDGDGNESPLSISLSEVKIGESLFPISAGEPGQILVVGENNTTSWEFFDIDGISTILEPAFNTFGDPRYANYYLPAYCVGDAVADDTAAINAVATRARLENPGGYIEINGGGKTYAISDELNMSGLMLTNCRLLALASTSWTSTNAMVAFRTLYNAGMRDVWCDANRQALNCVLTMPEGGMRFFNVRGTRFKDPNAIDTPKGFWAQGSVHVESCNFEQWQASDLEKNLEIERTGISYYLEGNVIDSRFLNCIGSRCLYPVYVHNDAHHIFFTACHFYQGDGPGQPAPWPNQIIAEINGADVNFIGCYLDLGRIRYNVSTDSPYHAFIGPDVWLTVDGSRTVANNAFTEFGAWVEITTNVPNTQLTRLKVSPNNSWTYSGTNPDNIITFTTTGTGSFSGNISPLATLRDSLLTTDTGLKVYADDTNSPVVLDLISSDTSDMAYIQFTPTPAGNVVRLGAEGEDFRVDIAGAEVLRYNTSEDTLNISAALITGTPKLALNGQQLLTERQPAIPNAAANINDVASKLNLVIQLLRTHGLIET